MIIPLQESYETECFWGYQTKGSASPIVIINRKLLHRSLGVRFHEEIPGNIDRVLFGDTLVLIWGG